MSHPLNLQTKEPPAEPQEILKEAGLSGPVAGFSIASPTFPQWAGSALAITLIGLILVSLLFVGIDWVRNVPVIPPLPTDSTAAKLAIDNYKTLSELSHEGSLKLLDATAGKFLTLVGTIIGYLLGAQSRGKKSDE